MKSGILVSGLAERLMQDRDMVKLLNSVWKGSHISIWNAGELRDIWRSLWLTSTSCKDCGQAERSVPVLSHPRAPVCHVYAYTDVFASLISSKSTPVPLTSMTPKCSCQRTEGACGKDWNQWQKYWFPWVRFHKLRAGSSSLNMAEEREEEGQRERTQECVPQ